MNKPLRILHLEDDPDYCDLVRSMLSKEGFEVELVVAGDRAGFEGALAPEKFDIILADYQVPSYNGLEALRLAREKCPETPVLLVSGHDRRAGGYRESQMRGDRLCSQAVAGAPGAGRAPRGRGGRGTARSGGALKPNWFGARSISAPSRRTRWTSSPFWIGKAGSCTTAPRSSACWGMSPKSWRDKRLCADPSRGPSRRSARV